MLDIFVINHVYDPRFRTASDLLDHLGLLTGWAEGLAEAGAQVVVVQRFPRDEVLTRGGVNYQMIADGFPPQLRSWQIPRRMQHLVCSAAAKNHTANRPTLVHLHGLIYPLHARRLRHRLPDSCGLVVQHHAELPHSGWRGRLQAWGLKHVDGFLFTSRELSTSWIEHGIIPCGRSVFESMECSSTLSHQERDVARAVTRMAGDPVFLWAGNLTPNKDPLTILAGFQQLLECRPAARLYMAYRGASLLPAVRAVIAQNEKLQRAVTLLGEIPYAGMGSYFNSADFFVQGSAKEGSGIAVLDALACGVVPVITDIPSFRTILQGGQVGALWPVGQVGAFVQAARELVSRPIYPQMLAAQSHFQQNWAYPQIGRRLLDVYGEVLARRSV